MLTLQEVAERLDVHYMTAYRYVRLGLLPAVKSAGQWIVDQDDLAHFTAPRDAAPPRSRSAPYAERYRARAIASDIKGAWAICESAMSSGHSAEEVYLNVIAPAMASIGEGWRAGDVSVAEEHRASAVATRTIGRLAHRLTRPGRTRGEIVIGAPAGDSHSLPVTMAADLLRGHGYDVLDLGANTPAGSFVEMVSSVEAPRAVLLTVTAPDRTDVVRETIAALKAAVDDVPVFVGGGAVVEEGYAADVGADGQFSSIEALLDHIEQR